MTHLNPRNSLLSFSAQGGLWLILASSILFSGCYKVLSRSAREQRLREQSLASNGIVDSAYTGKTIRESLISREAAKGDSIWG